MDRLEIITAANRDFRFLFDGQTLVIEDLLALKPGYHDIVAGLVKSGRLLIGPYYCQPDWKLSGGESLLRNILYGHKDVKKFNGQPGVGWLVDTFGHISQAPQLHRMFGIEAVYIWRGSPAMDPYFIWRGPDGSRIFTINLFGGYRNLYGVTHAPEIAPARLKAELKKLQAFYPTEDIPLFDGYDLEDNPEDPVRFFKNLPQDQLSDIHLKEATPGGFAQEMRLKLDNLPLISGELNSGKFGAIFPGTLSTRTYLKVMSRDCEYLLYQLCEPLGALAAIKGREYLTEQYEAWGRVLLQNSVHDCICGVSIDQVHEKMEFSYRQTFEAIQKDIHQSLAYILSNFAPGRYAVSTNPFQYEGWLIEKDCLTRIETNGIGVWETSERHPVISSGKIVEEFSWKNSHYEACVSSSGKVIVGEALLGSILVFQEHGDAYSGEAGLLLGELKPSGTLLLEQESDFHARLRIPLAAAWGDIQVSVNLLLTFDDTPVIRWEIEIDSQGTDFRVDIVFETAQAGEIYAGMPFDAVNRPRVDGDLLPSNLEKNLSEVLIGQRELGVTRTFPFHDFVAVSDGSRTAAVLAKGLHAYEAGENGRISIILRRSIQWLTKTNLPHRTGDAGPFFYVPDARCERLVKHELAVVFGSFRVEEPAFSALNAGYLNPPLIIENQGSGMLNHWEVFREYLPLSSMQVVRERILVRLFNPSSLPQLLSKAYLETDPACKPHTNLQVVNPKKIVTLALDQALLPVGINDNVIDEKSIDILNLPGWRVGSNKSEPEAAVIEQLEEHLRHLEGREEEVKAKLSNTSGQEHYILQHQLYIVQREMLETRLTLRLNEIKKSKHEEPERDYLYGQDEEVAQIGRELNQMRIKRRIYDYIVQLKDHDRRNP